MSNNILPSFPGITWGIQKKPLWNTNVSDAISGRQFALRRRLYPVWRFKLPYELLRTQASLTELQQIVGFFNSRNGRYDDWLYLDPRENAATAQQIGIGNGTQTVYPIVKSYGGFTEPVGAVNPATLQVFRNDWQGNQTLYSTARVNLMLRSQELDNASWGAIGAKNVTANSAVAPDGTTTADTVSDVSAAAFQGITQSVTVPNDSLRWYFSIYVKKTTGGTSPTLGINVSLSGGSSTSGTVRLNTDTGGTTGSGGTGPVVSVGDYWRVSVFADNNSTGNTVFSVSIYPATSAYGGGGSDTVAATGSQIIWGAQCEQSATGPTSYIPTAGSVVQVIDYALNNATGNTRKNWLLRSEEFDNASWLKSVVTVTANGVMAPDGTMTADSLASTGADGLVYQAVSATAGTKFTYSIWLKALVATNVTLVCTQSGGVTTFASSNVNVTTQWQRFQVSGTAVPGTTSVQVTIGGFGTFTSGEVLHAWGAQLELGVLVASDYIKTTTVAVTVTDPDSASYRDTLTFAVAPVNGATLTWTGTYYYRCRFVNEDLPLEEFMSGKWKSDLEFRSFRP